MVINGDYYRCSLAYAGFCIHWRSPIVLVSPCFGRRGTMQRWATKSTFMERSCWMNYSDLTATSLEWWLEMAIIGHFQIRTSISGWWIIESWQIVIIHPDMDNWYSIHSGCEAARILRFFWDHRWWIRLGFSTWIPWVLPVLLVLVVVKVGSSRWDFLSPSPNGFETDLVI